MKRFFAIIAVFAVISSATVSAVACEGETPSYNGDSTSSASEAYSTHQADSAGQTDSAYQTSENSDENELPLVPLD